jgi:hypothetical protein
MISNVIYSCYELLLDMYKLLWYLRSLGRVDTTTSMGSIQLVQKFLHTKSELWIFMVPAERKREEWRECWFSNQTNKISISC